MPIQSTELIWRTPALASGTTPAQNGGRMTRNISADNAANNDFPNVTQAQRIAGLTTWRKRHLHVASAAEVAALNNRIYLNATTPGADWVHFCPGTHTDTQDTLLASTPDYYGGATLLAAIASAATALSLVPEDMASATALQPWRAGQLIRISNQPYDDDAANTTWATIAAVAYAADRINITLGAPGATAAHAAGTYVAGVYVVPSVQASATAPVITSTAGTFTAPVVHNIGTVLQNVTLTFTSPTAFGISGDTLGSLGNGTTTSTTAPTAAGAGGPYFTLPSTAFGGSFVAGATITFTTSPAAIPIWLRRDVPANCPSLTGNSASWAWTCESA